MAKPGTPLVTVDSAALSPLTEAQSFATSYQLVSASNATLVLRDSAGALHTRVDMMSVYGAVNFGHLNPTIEPFRSPQADIAACFYPRSGYEVAAWLCDRLRTPDHSVLYQVGGSLAVSAAIALAQHVRPGRVVTIRGGFHGLGVDSLAASSAGRDCSVQDGPLVRHLAGLFTPVEAGHQVTDWSGMSCLLYEPVQGANGYVPLDPPWLKSLESSARRAGVITIADEVQSGYFRHGSLSAAQAIGLTPDVLVFSKSMTNGLFPLSAVVYPRAFHSAVPRRSVHWAHTFQTSALGCDAAWAVAQYVDREPVEAMARAVEQRLSQIVPRLSQMPWIEEVHVTGPTLSFGVHDNAAGEVVASCEQLGVLVFTGGDGRASRRVRVAPPITIPSDQLEQALNCIVEGAASRARKGASRPAAATHH